MIAFVDPHPFRVALYHLQRLPVLCAKGGEEICHLLLFHLTALRCCIIRRHTVGSVRVRNSSLFVQQRLKHVPVDPHRPCGTSRDDVNAICCLFVCCCFIVSYKLTCDVETCYKTRHYVYKTNHVADRFIHSNLLYPKPKTLAPHFCHKKYNISPPSFLNIQTEYRPIFVT